MAGPAVLVVALGTRGDVQPLAVLARGLLLRWNAARATLVTHAHHAAWLHSDGLLEGPGLEVDLATVKEPPGRQWAGLGEEAVPSTQPDAAALQEELLAACCGALGCDVPGGPPTAGAAGSPSGRQGAASSPTHDVATARAALGPAAPARPPQGCLLVFNLFALDAFHIAEALGLPAVAAHPYQIPYSAPTGFAGRFRRAHLALHAALVAAEGNEEGRVSWQEVTHWMWPLFAERFEGWRLRLGLDPVPLQQQQCEARGGALPAATPLLYGFSQSVVARPHFWQPSISVCGFWLPTPPRAPAQHLARAAESPPLPAGAGAWLAAATVDAAPGSGGPVPPAAGGVLLVDFGSMGRLGLVPEPERLVAAVAGAALLLGARLRVLLLAGCWRPLHEAAVAAGMADVTAYAAGSGPAAMVAHAGALPHADLLPRCAAILHHGGSGTVAAALAAGVPQVICPLQFDQPLWAERLAYLGLAAPPLDRELLFGALPLPGGTAAEAAAGSSDRAAAALAAAITQACSAEVQGACSQMAEQLATEDGVEAAGQAIDKHWAAALEDALPP